MRIEDEHINAVLRGEDIFLPEEIKETIRKESGDHAKGILDGLRELQVDLRADPAIFMGGGSILLRTFLEQSSQVSKADFVEDTHANAVGYELLAKNQMRRMTSEE